MKHAMRLLPVLLAAFMLSGCGIGSWFDDDDPPLEGDRISVLELQQALEPEDPVLAEQGLIAPTPWHNDFWPQAGGYPNHSMQHLALNEGALKKVWDIDIGKGGSKSRPITAQPIVVDNLVFTMDADSILRAFDIRTGKEYWNLDVGDPKEDNVISGGMAFSAGKLYVTNGFNQLLAVDPSQGKIVWRKTTSAPARAAPTIMEDRVFVTTLDNRLMALNAADGALIWEYTGLSETAGLLGGASAAANRDVVVPAFSSGEITALRIENGSVAWSDNLANLRRVGGLAGLADIKGLPVIDRGLIIAISYSGRLVAIDERSGTRVWQREISGAETPWVAGNHIFLLSSDNQLVALGRDTGVIRWVTNLARYGDPDDREDPIIWTGPVLAGGRLILAGTDGRIVEIAPENGKAVREWSVKKTISIPPVVAGGVLYLLANDGTLMAFK